MILVARHLYFIRCNDLSTIVQSYTLDVSISEDTAHFGGIVELIKID